MFKLFNEKKITDYFEYTEQILKDSVTYLSDKDWVTMDVAKASIQLADQYKIIAPTINKEKTTNEISMQKIPGNQLPPGTSYIPGRLYDIEFVTYTIPTQGKNELFEYIPNNSVSGYFIGKEILSRGITIELTCWGIINGNDEAIENLKIHFLSYIDFIEKNIYAIKCDVDKFNSELINVATNYLEEKVRQAKIRNDSKNKLNPFA